MVGWVASTIVMLDFAPAQTLVPLVDVRRLDGAFARLRTLTTRPILLRQRHDLVLEVGLLQVGRLDLRQALGGRNIDRSQGPGVLQGFAESAARCRRFS